MDFEEIPYPVKMYRTRLKDDHARNTEEAFEELIRRSKVDTEANAKLVAEIRKLQKQVESFNAILGRWRLLKGLLILLVLLGLAGIVLYLFQVCGNSLVDFKIPHLWGGICFAVVPLALWLILSQVNRKIKQYKTQIEEKQKELAEKIRQAWAQMAPLNELFRWDTITKIVMKTIPIIKIDSYCSQSRIESLCRHFHWKPSSDDPTRSIVSCQSGTINGNPWLMAEDFQQYWGTKIYSGSITISWEERETYTDSNGKTHTRWVTRHQTLTATVEKPKPFYRTGKYLVYGNEAAPELNFSRAPNSLSSQGNGFFGRRRLKSAINALEKKSRDLDDPFTIMDNREFDACFNAVDRDNELQFRVLFSPLAQQEMLNLLRDHDQGFGDDFVFRKKKMVNILASDHLSAFDFSGSPERFIKYDFAEIKKIFLDYSNDFFRNFYFSMAPLLCIPLYQEYRNYQDIYDGIIDSGEASFFEYESFANAMEEALFKPSDSITPSILKTRTTGKDDKAVQLSVSAYAFRGEERVDYVSVFGGDGKSHRVPVHWTEYLPVAKKTPMTVCETGTSDPHEFEQLSKNETWQALFSRWDALPDTLHFRRNLAAFIHRAG